MSTALVVTLRESCGYLRDDGYHQTARLIAVAADEIERLNRRVQALEAGHRPLLSRRRSGINATAADNSAVDPRRHQGP